MSQAESICKQLNSINPFLETKEDSRLYRQVLFDSMKISGDVAVQSSAGLLILPSKVNPLKTSKTIEIVCERELNHNGLKEQNNKGFS